MAGVAVVVLDEQETGLALGGGGARASGVEAIDDGHGIGQKTIERAHVLSETHFRVSGWQVNRRKMRRP
ncbi:MAG: hypothetical protein M3P50_12740 [Actinomycetota bacterium]|nr:hypothetical protein [Actinomycetota bacterium]